MMIAAPGGQQLRRGGGRSARTRDPARNGACPLTEGGDNEDGAAERGYRRRAEILSRLYRALGDKLREIEQRIARCRDEGDTLSPADSERDARTLNALARLLEKLTGIDDAGADAPNDKREPNPKEIDAERLRRDIAERIARLRQRGAS